MLRDHMAKLATGIKISATVALRSRSASLFSLSRMPEADVRQRLPGGEEFVTAAPDRDREGTRGELVLTIWPLTMWS